MGLMTGSGPLGKHPAGSFNFEYGYVQVEARIAMGTGLWPALWLAASNLQWPPEIDIMEHWDSASYYGTYQHITDSFSEENSHVGVPDISGWHTYSVSWEPGKITWYVDNEPVFSSTDSVPHQSMYFIANVAESDPVTSSADCNGTMQISSVKIWQHS